jgi:hypothetical protein
LGSHQDNKVKVANTQSYIIWLVGAGVILTLWLLAWYRPNRQRLVWRIVASTLAGVSLTFMVFPPTRQLPVDSETAVLLTQGYDSDSLKAFLSKQEAQQLVFSYKVNSGNTAKPLTALQDLEQQPNLQALHLFGYGLEEQELQAIKKLKIIPHITAIPDGLQRINWTKNIKLGEHVEVSGNYAAYSKFTKLYLLADSKVRDSATISSKEVRFHLRYAPKQSGHFTYALLAKNNDKADTLGQLPISVDQGQPIRVLLIAAAPNFEFKFLKNHLAALNHQVTLRTTVSKNIYQSEWLNMPKTEFSKITPQLLKAFDIVITEPQALQSFNYDELSALKSAVSEHGLGVLTVTSLPIINKESAFFMDFNTKKLSDKDIRTTTATWLNTHETSTFAAGYTIINSPNLSSLVVEPHKGLLVASKPIGWGTIAMSLIPQTFQWKIEGKSGLYASYWAKLLSEVAKEEEKEKFWNIALPAFPKVDQPVKLTYTDYKQYNSQNTPDVGIINLRDSIRVILPMAQEIYQPEKYSGTFWPSKSGWHRIHTQDSEPYLFYVHEPSSWSFDAVASKQQATINHIAKQKASISDSTSGTYKDEPVPIIWFFMMFALSTGFLWFEEKL